MAELIRREPTDVAWDHEDAVLSGAAVRGTALELVTAGRTDFSEYTTDAAPSGWTARWVTTHIAYTVRAREGAIGGKYLQAANALSTNGRRGLSWGSAENVDIVTRLNVSHFSNTSTRTIHGGPFARGSGAAGSETMYVAAVSRANTTGSERLAIVKYVNGSFTELGSYTFAWTGRQNWIRFQVNGTALKAKIWQGARGDQPSGWDIEVTNSDVSGSGWFGAFHFYTSGSSQRYDWDVFELAYNPTSGSRRSPELDMSTAGTHEFSSIAWTASTPTGTTLTISAAVTEGDPPGSEDWTVLSSGDPIPGLVEDEDLTGQYLWLKQELATTDAHASPSLRNLTVTINGDSTAIPLYLGSQQVVAVYLGSVNITGVLVGG